MGKKKALKRLIFQEILTSKARFISIMLLILIGVSFYSALNASGPDMLKTAELYFNNRHLMDIHVVSTMGLEDEDIEILKLHEDIDQIEAGYSQDVLTSKENKILKVYSYDSSQTLNQLEVKSGKLPENSGEIALVASDEIEKLYQIGDTVSFLSDSEDTNLSEQFDKSNYTVVGFVKSPFYVSDKQLGSSTIGKGTLDGYGIIIAEDFNLSVYTDAYMTFKSLKGVDSCSNLYKNTIETYQEEIESSFDERSVIRLADIKGEAQEKLTDAKQEVSEGKKELTDAETKLEDAKAQIEDGTSQIAEAKIELQDAKKKLEDGQAEYDENKAIFDEKIADGKAQLDIGGNQLAQGQSTLDENKEKVKQGKAQVDEGLKQIEAQTVTLTEQKSQMEAFLEQTKQIIEVPIAYITTEQQNTLIQAGSAVTIGDSLTLGDLWTAYFTNSTSGSTIVDALESILSQIDAGLVTLADTKKQLLEKQEELDNAQAQINSGQEELNTGADTIIVKSQEFEEAKADGESQLAEAKKKLEDGWAEYEDGAATLLEEEQKLEDAKQEYEEGLAKFNENKADAQKEIADAEEKIADGEKKLADLKSLTYYALAREDNPGYSEYADNAKRLSALSVVFPTFFFAIAALVCLTTITRMIEEQRVQIGTLKAQGYTNGEISLKYYVYALGAGGVGTLLGLLLGFYGIPRIIVSAYSPMYELPNQQFDAYLSIGMISVAIAVFSTGISVWAVLHQELKECPATLMRPKAPKVGKRIFLERMTLIWNRLNFVQKVTMRNLFRYKQRMIMTVFGIAGCMGLMMTGFGIKDSLADIPNLQYNTIIHYQALAVFDEDASNAKKEEAKAAIANMNGLNDYLMIWEGLYDVKHAGVNTQQVLLVVPEDTQKFSQFVSLRNQGSDSSYELPENGAVITQKLADLFRVKAGDSITITDADNQEYVIPIAKITENYTGHYIYMSPQTYQECFNSTAIQYNGTLLQYEQDEAWEETVSKSLNQYSAIQTISYNSSVIETLNHSLDSLNAVVLVIIIAAAVLAFVVLYNLTNINVSERIRELSTIKVLGFYDNEVTMYIYRENVILSLLGIFFGSFLGKFLHYFVLDTALMDNMTFQNSLHVLSYVFAGALTLLFATLVMWVMHNRLKHVDMIEALKSND